jgi:hypothetical protein
MKFEWVWFEIKFIWIELTNLNGFKHPALWLGPHVSGTASPVPRCPVVTRLPRSRVVVAGPRCRSATHPICCPLLSTPLLATSRSSPHPIPPPPSRFFGSKRPALFLIARPPRELPTTPSAPKTFTIPYHPHWTPPSAQGRHTSPDFDQNATAFLLSGECCLNPNTLWFESPSPSSSPHRATGAPWRPRVPLERRHRWETPSRCRLCHPTVAPLARWAPVSLTMRHGLTVVPWCSCRIPRCTSLRRLPSATSLPSPLYTRPQHGPIKPHWPVGQARGVLPRVESDPALCGDFSDFSFIFSENCRNFKNL